jgi:DNA-binding NtrC family response regulator
MLPHKKISILVVDDELSIRESLSGWLQQDGYEVASAADGPTALSMLQSRHYDIMLLDVKIPQMDGITVLKRLKETEAETAVVMMTAHGTIQDAVEAMKVGAYDYLLKPFDTGATPGQPWKPAGGCGWVWMTLARKSWAPPMRSGCPSRERTWSGTGWP